MVAGCERSALSAFDREGLIGALLRTCRPAAVQTSGVGDAHAPSNVLTRRS